MNVDVSESKGQVTVIGFVLVIAIVVLLLAIYEASIYPSIASQQEFEAQQQLRSTAPEIQAKIASTIATGVPQTVVFSAASQLPPRLLPSPQPTLTVQTENFNSPVYVENTREIGTTNSTDFSRNTEFLFVQGNYFFTEQNRGILHQSFITTTAHKQNKFRPDPNNNEVAVTSQQVLSGKRILIPVTKGEIFRTSQSSNSVTIVPSEIIYQNKKITNKPGTKVEITLPTTASEEFWRNELEDELVGNGGYIQRIEYSGTDPVGSGSNRVNYVTITLLSGNDYTITAYEVKYK